jgi:hypothetical protein
LFGAAQSVIDYWTDRRGRDKALEISRVTGVVPAFKYHDWVRDVRSASLTPHLLVAYVLAVQLKRVPQRTENALRLHLHEGNFTADTEFTIWAEPSSLHTGSGGLAVPVDCRYDELPRFVEKAEWDVIRPNLVNHVRRATSGKSVPLFWWHTEEQDLAGGHVHVEVEAMSFDKILAGVGVIAAWSENEGYQRGSPL